MKKIYFIVLICVFTIFVIFGVIHIKKSREQVINIDNSNNNKTTETTLDNKVILTLPNQGDGGYQFDNPKYDTSILKLLSHEHTDSNNTKTLGNFGNDIWTFQTLKKGQTDLILTISRPWEENSSESYFQTQIIIQ